MGRKQKRSAVDSDDEAVNEEKTENVAKEKNVKKAAPKKKAGKKGKAESDSEPEVQADVKAALNKKKNKKGKRKNEASSSESEKEFKAGETKPKAETDSKIEAKPTQPAKKQKKGKKGRKDSFASESEHGVSDIEKEEPTAPVGLMGKKKGKLQLQPSMSPSEDSSEENLSEEEKEEMKKEQKRDVKPPPAKKQKKGKKGRKESFSSSESDHDISDASEVEDESLKKTETKIPEDKKKPEVTAPPAMKQKKGKKGRNFDSESEHDDVSDDEENISETKTKTNLSTQGIKKVETKQPAPKKQKKGKKGRNFDSESESEHSSEVEKDEDMKTTTVEQKTTTVEQKTTTEGPSTIPEPAFAAPVEMSEEALAKLPPKVREMMIKKMKLEKAAAERKQKEIEKREAEKLKKMKIQEEKEREEAAARQLIENEKKAIEQKKQDKKLDKMAVQEKVQSVLVITTKKKKKQEIKVEPKEEIEPIASKMVDAEEEEEEDEWLVEMKKEKEKEKEKEKAVEESPKEMKKQKQPKGRRAREDSEPELEAADGAEGVEELRSPILCIMGHVDTGKTKLLDKIRHTNVQLGEAGGITQQIGATFFPRENLMAQSAKVDPTLVMKVPGLLVIDTPGHASFSNLRKRGSSLCDMAILVVDIMHGLEPQTKESIEMLKQRKCPFVIALNKIDRLYGWVVCEWSAIKNTMKKQKAHTIDEFEKRANDAILQLATESLNCDLYWKVKNVRKYVSVVPTSAHTGEGIPDLLTLVVRLTQDVMTKQMTLDRSRLECTILEVKNIEGLGTTIDVILVAGILYEGDRIAVCGMNGPIITNIRALLTPQPLKELRVKSDYIHHTSVKAAMGVKISAPGLEDAVAGSALMVIPPDADEDKIEEIKDAVSEDMSAIFNSVDKTKLGCYVMASTLGSLEALLQFLKDSTIPVSAVSIGTVNSLDVKKAAVAIDRGSPQYAVILAFDVKVSEEATLEASRTGVTIMTADIIYHLFDSFTAFLKAYEDKRREEKTGEVVFPCELKILEQHIFMKKDPLIFGVKVLDGELRIGTPLVVDKTLLRIGRVETIELKEKPVTSAAKGEEVCIKVTGEPSVTYGRQFDHKNILYSKISRNSIDCMKEFFIDDLKKHAKLVQQLKKILSIM